MVNQNTSNQPQPQPHPQEKKEFFQRGEVRTMRKDIARLQEEEALKERERIAALKTEEEIKKERERIERLKREEEERRIAILEQKEKARISLKEAETPKPPPEKELKDKEKELKEELKEVWPKPEYRFPFPLPKKPSHFDNFFARAVIIAILIALWGTIATFWYWYFAVRPRETTVLPPASEETLPPTEKVPPPTEEVPPPTEKLPPPEELPPPQVPPSPVAMDNEQFMQISNLQELPVTFNQAIQQFFGENKFTRIVVHNIQDNTLLSLPQFFQAFQIASPPDFLEKLSPDFTLFVYSSIITNRVGFIAKIENIDGFENLVRTWEQTMETDTAYLFSILGRREPAKDKTFRSATYKGRVFRYVSFPTINFGIVWGIFEITTQTGEKQNYFVFTSSGESMMRTIDKIITP